MSGKFLAVSVSFLSCLWLGESTLVAQDAEPATAAEAAKVLDLSTWPLVDPVDETRSQVIASQSYLAKGSVLDVARKSQSALKAIGWKELDGATITEGYASASFQKSGFSISLTIMPGNESNTASVSIINHGNVDLKKIPVPEGAQEIYALPMSIMYVSDLPVAEAVSGCGKLLAEQGWEPFGVTTVSFFVKKNAIRLQVMVSESPAQQGKTAIQIFGEQMSFDLPAPPDVEGLQYTDSTGQMMFDSPKSRAEWVTWFSGKLGESGWKATTENLVKIDFKEHMIFSSPGGELIELAFSNFDEKTRVALKYSTAAQVAASNEAASAAMARLKAERDAESNKRMNPAKISIVAPAGTTVGEATGNRIEFSTASGAARSSLAEWIKKQESDGWRLKTLIDQKEAGEYQLTRAEQTLSVGFIDPGFIPGSITISLSGDGQLELVK